MSLTPGTRLGVFTLLQEIGRGGMGEVYRARDTKLDRDVAIKVLPEAFAHDAERLARFLREAKTLASLNHPNIAAIYGLEDADGTKALVMELVEGDDLSQRIARGAIPIDEALPIAKQIADALEAAHEQGIIHRDLKPANIKVRSDGTVKVLDFGLAKAIEPIGGMSPSMSMAPTITTPAMMTGVGMILGTAAYMSPEQARGKTVDKRADIWAFGAVLFEMLTGQRAFSGEDVADVLSRVLQREPDFDALPPTVPTRVSQALRLCLRKDSKQRVGDIRDVRLALEGAFETDVPQVMAPVGVAQRGHLASMTAGVLLTAVVAGAAGWWFGRPAGSVAQRVSRVQLVVSGAAALSVTGTDRDLAITPDGARVVYVGNRGTQLFVRALDTLEPVAVYTGVPRGPFVSPNGQWVGFVDAADSTGAEAQFVTRLKKVAVTGGPAMTLATLPYQPRGATWAPGEAIILATSDPETGLQRVATTGGTPTVLTRPDRAHGEADHLWPEQLPGGRAVLFTITALTGGLDAAQVAVLDLQTGKHTVLLRGGSHAHYVPSGHLVYATQGTLRAVLFDLSTLKTRGTPTLVIPDVVTTATGSLDAVATADGTLAYVSGGAAVSSGQAPRTLVWVDREGRETPISAPPRAYVQPRLSPDGTRVAVVARDQETDIWLWDLMRATLTRLTFDPGTDTTPAWTPDSRRILFSSSRGSGQNIYIQAADGTGSAARLTDSPNTLNVNGMTADGMRVVFHELTPNRQRDLGLLTLAPPRVESLVETPFEERGGIVSPDGRWLAFESNNSGRFEIYVRPFPNVADGQWQVSNAGGVQPLWAPSGRELFFVATDGALMTVAIESRGTTWNAGAAKTLLEGRYYTGDTSYVSRHYDVSPDGQRFLMIKESGTGQTAAPPQLIVVQHFDEELKRIVPAN